MGVECRLVKADEEMLKKSDVNLSRVNHGYVESDRMTQLKTKIEKVQGTIRAKNKKGESAEKQLKELQLYQLEQESLLLKHFVEMKYIIPLLQERLSSFDNLLSRTSSNDNGYAVRELSKYEWDEFAGAMKLTSVKGSQYTRDAVDIFPIREDGNCMYNAIRNGLSRLPEAYTGNREVTLNDLRAEVADEIEGNFQFYVEDLEAQLLANIIEGDVVGFNTQVGNIIFTLNNLYLTLLHDGYTVGQAQEAIANQIEQENLAELYRHMIRENGAWGGNVELGIVAERLGVQIHVHRRDGQYAPLINENHDLPIIHLDYNGGHYNLITNLPSYNDEVTTEEVYDHIPDFDSSSYDIATLIGLTIIMEEMGSFKL
jgi:hypothetical protein